eukprot:10462811-Karenia_brevis.AAC.1
MYSTGVPWPIAWLILRRHRKHISTSRVLPKLQTIHQSLTEFSHKMRWRWKLQNDDQVGILPHWALVRGPVTKFSGLADPLVE